MRVTVFLGESLPRLYNRIKAIYVSSVSNQTRGLSQMIRSQAGAWQRVVKKQTSLYFILVPKLLLGNGSFERGSASIC